MELFALLDGLELLEPGGQFETAEIYRWPREFRDWSMGQWSQTFLSWHRLVGDLLGLLKIHHGPSSNELYLTSERRDLAASDRGASRHEERRFFCAQCEQKSAS